MPDFKRYIKRALTNPPGETMRKAAGKIRGKLDAASRRRYDASNSTFDRPDFGGRGLLSYFNGLSPGCFAHVSKGLAAVSDLYVRHRFDLLGSGWTAVEHGVECRGLEGNVYGPNPAVSPDSEGKWLEDRINPANLEDSKKIWRLVDTGYVPIDWHLDFKSGYRWREGTWYPDIDYGGMPGVDVKVPWELARMQHLPQTAAAFGLASAGAKGFRAPEDYSREFRNQVLDFTATNPPRYGVNWKCTMDVAIRAANMLVARDLFRAFGAQFDEEFEQEFTCAIYRHGLYIVENLEWLQEFRSNHYLADIAGLVFVSAYLPVTDETSAWLAFAVRELVREFELQFNPDGTNFEASTCYHRLSTEIVVYATALVLGLGEDKKSALRSGDISFDPGAAPEFSGPVEFFEAPGGGGSSPFPPWYIERLEKAAEFTMHCTRPDGHVCQVGDNDSGRFFKLYPVFAGNDRSDAGPAEDHLDHRHLVSAVNSFFDRQDFTEFSRPGLETDIIHLLSGGARFQSYKSAGEPSAEKVRTGDESVIKEAEEILSNAPEGSVCAYSFAVDKNILEKGLDLYGYTGFGMYIFRSERFFMAVRCGSTGQNGNGGHAHNDQLCVELEIDGKMITRDPGTYLYTPLPERRNEYRSVAAHFAPRAAGGAEPSGLEAGLFTLDGDPQAECLYFRENGFVGHHTGYGVPVCRMIKISEGKIEITDFSTGIELEKAGGEDSVETGPPPFSPGYGIRIDE